MSHPEFLIPKVPATQAGSQVILRLLTWNHILGTTGLGQSIKTSQSSSQAACRCEEKKMKE